MDDEQRFALEEQAEAEALREYNRGLDKCRNVLEKNPNATVTEHCPWCNKLSYDFCTVGGWVCDECGYYPGADLFGGRYS